MISTAKYGFSIAYKNTNKKILNARYLLNSNSVFSKHLASVTSHTNNHNDRQKNNSHFRRNLYKYIFGASGLIGYELYKFNKLEVYCEEKENVNNDTEAGRFIKELPVYTEEQVREHGKNADRIWVSYKNGVYDITDFIEGHPGGNKILQAAGSSIEPFWEIYTVHKKPEYFEMLEELRIGNLKVSNEKKTNQTPKITDAYADEPKRHPLLSILTQKPFNAETPKEFSVDNLITPNELHFIRNHMPVPQIDTANFKLEILNEVNGKKFEFNLQDLQTKFSSFTIPVTIQCSGNKRKFMHEYEPVQGLMWDVNGISTAEWTGVRLKDLLDYCGINLNDDRIKHVHFEGLDKDPSGGVYAASIPIEKVKQDNGDVMVAFKMNGVDIPLDHGYPLRIITPGIIGARSVKWLGKIILSNEECQSHWQLKDYKMLSPNVKNLKEADFSKYKAMQESPVQSAICEPAEGAKIKKENQTFTVKGYAFSGGGNDIESVHISLDNGKTWSSAQLKKFDSPLYKSWAWTIWETELKIPEGQDKVEIICVATDSNQNTQPESFKSIWNARGLMNNAWHRVNVSLE